MGLISIIGLIWSVITSLPQVFSTIKAIIAMIKSLGGKQVVGYDAASFASELKESLKEIRENKDASRLERLHKRLSDLCAGGVCEPVSAVQP